MDREIRDGFKFCGGHLALDFTATLAGRRRAQPRDLLAAPGDLARWLAAAELAPHAAVSARQLDDARALREAIYALARARVDERAGAAADRELVNRWAQRPPHVPQLTARGIVWSGDTPSLCATLARAAVELLGTQADRIRGCHGDGCAILFLDSSRAGERRWCSMARCGNKAKVRRFRQT